MTRILTGGMWAWVLTACMYSAVQAETFDAGIPEGWSCEGSCGVGVADGVVAVAPSGGQQYGWVATAGSPVRSLGLPGIGGTNGSRLRSAPFAAKEGDLLEFQFDYVTSDGSGFADYAWARLLNASLEPVALLFTARTRSSGNIVPGFGMPEIAAEIEPDNVNIIGGGPRWSPLSGDSGRCFASGCGHTDWVDSRYTIPAAGEYVLEFGVINWSDTLFQSGLAFDGVIVGGKPIGAEPDYRDVRVVARVAAAGARLETEGFATEPSRIEKIGGFFEIEWRFDGFSIGQVHELGFPLTLASPRPGETRRVVEEVEIRYLDLLGQEHQSRLGPLDVHVKPSAFSLEMAADREIYLPGDPARLTLRVSNLGADGNVPEIEWEIRDEAGHLVTGLPSIGGLSFQPGETRTFVDESLETADLYAGEYVATARLSDPLTDGVLQAHAFFRVAVPVDTGLTAMIRVDRPAYDVHETVEISAWLENTAPNAQVAGHEVRLQVLDPESAEIWRTTVHPGGLAAGGTQELARLLPLGAAAAGRYRVLLAAIDASGSISAVAETSFEVTSTANTGAGLSGTLAIAPDTVLRTENLTLHASLANEGNAAISGLPVELLLLDPDTESPIGAWTRFADVERGETESLTAVWNVDVPAETVLVAVLRAAFEGEYRVLATTSVRVQERFISDPGVGGRGRLLVLLDPPAHEECIAVQGLELRLPGIGPLAPGELLKVELYDDRGRLLDSETVHRDADWPIDLTTGAESNLALVGIAGGAVELKLEPAGYAGRGTGTVRVAAHVQRQDSVMRFDSGAFGSHCGKLPELGSNVGDFQLTDLQMEASGNSVHRRRFLESLLNEEGWSYRVVTSGLSFAEELRHGGYTNFLLLANRVKLDNQVARELREAVFAGRGIVKANAEDHRNHHLLEVFGADLLGLQPHATGLFGNAASPVVVPAGTFAVSGRAVEVRVHDGSAIAEYRGDRRQRTGIAAASTHRFGKGRALLAGFDLLAYAKAEGISGEFAGFLTEALEYTRPDAVPLRPGMSVPVRWKLANRGGPASVILTLEASGGSITDPGTGVANGTGVLAYVLDMPTESVSEQEFWWRVPWESETAAQITAILELGEGVDSVLYDVTTHDFAIDGLPTFADLTQRVQARLSHHQHYENVLKELRIGASVHVQGETRMAVVSLLKAADWLSRIDEPEALNIRLSLAWLVHRLGPEIRTD